MSAVGLCWLVPVSFRGEAGAHKGGEEGGRARQVVQGALPGEGLGQKRRFPSRGEDGAPLPLSGCWVSASASSGDRSRIRKRR